MDLSSVWTQAWRWCPIRCDLVWKWVPPKLHGQNGNFPGIRSPFGKRRTVLNRYGFESWSLHSKRPGAEDDDDGRCYGGCKKQEIQKCVTKATFGYIQHHSASFRGFLSHGTPPTHPFQQDFPLKKSHPWLRNPPLFAWRCQGSASPVPETSQGDDKARRQRHPPNVFFSWNNL